MPKDKDLETKVLVRSAGTISSFTDKWCKLAWEGKLLQVGSKSSYKAIKVFSQPQLHRSRAGAA